MARGKNSAAAVAPADLYDASSIDVLEGLEPVRLRPGMYIGGTDSAALHHLFSEIIDNSIDEVVARHAKRIEVSLDAEGFLTVKDDGRGIPVDPHPKFPKKSAAEIVLTTLHAGGKFSGKNYETSGGLHGVGLSVVNALSDRLEIEIAKSGYFWRQSYSRGKPLSEMLKGEKTSGSGTKIGFSPDPEIFGDLEFDALKIYNKCRSKAYLVGDVTIEWRTNIVRDDVPAQAIIHFPGGISDAVANEIGDNPDTVAKIWRGNADLSRGRVEWALAWMRSGRTDLSSYCNTIATPLGGTHQNGFRAALIRALRSWGEIVKNPKTKNIAAEDLDGAIFAKLSCYIADPQFQGQTKDKLTNNDIARQVETAVKDHIDQYLADDPKRANAILEILIANAEARTAEDNAKTDRKTTTNRRRLPGKLADCSRNEAGDTEIFLVEGDSAGGSAKQARDRATQAILPLRGKTLNAISASSEKLDANQELRDLTEALGCGMGRNFDVGRLRYERVIIMTDADVDGAHIGTLLLSFFYSKMPGLIRTHRLYLANPPLFRLTVGDKSTYVFNDTERDVFIRDAAKRNKKVDVSRFKGLGEMPPSALKETTMDPKRRSLIRVQIDDSDEQSTAERVEQLMGKRPEARFRFIQENSGLIRSVA